MRLLRTRNRVQQAKKSFGKPKYNKQSADGSKAVTKPKHTNDKPDKCFRCGASHSPSKCKYIEATCHGCGKKGHIRPACITTKKGQKGASNKPNTNTVDSDESNSQYAVGFGLYQTRGGYQ